MATYDFAALVKRFEDASERWPRLNANLVTRGDSIFCQFLPNDAPEDAKIEFGLLTMTAHKALREAGERLRDVAHGMSAPAMILAWAFHITGHHLGGAILCNPEIDDTPIERCQSSAGNVFRHVAHALAVFSRQGNPETPVLESSKWGQELQRLPSPPDDTERRMRLMEMGFDPATLSAVMVVLENGALTAEQRLRELSKIDNVVDSGKFTAGELAYILDVTDGAVRGMEFWKKRKERQQAARRR